MATTEVDLPSGTAIVNMRGFRQNGQKKDKETVIKAVLLGDYSVGKTTLFKRIREKELSLSTSWNSQSLDLCNLSIDLPNRKKVQLHLWDTAGAERYRTLTLDYFRKALIIFLMYRADRLITLTDLKYWKSEAETYAPPNAVYILVGNVFTDTNIEVSIETADDFATKHNISAHIRLSAATAAERNIAGMLMSAVEKVTNSVTTLPPQQATGTVQPQVKDTAENPDSRTNWCWCR